MHMTSVRHSAVSSSSLVEDHASALIEELFQGLEDELDGLGKQPSTSDRHGSPASNSLLLRLQPSDPEIEETGLLVPYIKMEDATLESSYNTELTPPPPSTSDPSNDGFGQGILLGMACFSLIGSIGLWLFTQAKQPVAPSVAAQPAPQVSTPANPADVAFATESEQTLQSLENSPPPLAVTPVATAATAALPSITANPAAAIAPSAPSVALLAKKTVSVAVKNPPSAPPLAYVRKIESAPLPSLQPLALSTVPDPKSSASKVIKAPVAAIPATVPNLAPQALPMGRQAKAGKVAKAGVTVQGILDLGDKSAMLIARNGSTQNIHPGETLDSTGWVFVRVENGQAIVQRGNEVRAVSGGEEF
jgi:hypothetical protein